MKPLKKMPEDAEAIASNDEENKDEIVNEPEADVK